MMPVLKLGHDLNLIFTCFQEKIETESPMSLSFQIVKILQLKAQRFEIKHTKNVDVISQNEVTLRLKTYENLNIKSY